MCMWDLSSLTGIEPVSPAGVRLNHWTTKEVPAFLFPISQPSLDVGKQTMKTQKEQRPKLQNINGIFTPNEIFKEAL